MTSLNPLWARAPLTLFRFRALLLSVVGASALLSLAVAVGPLFLSATANAGLADALRETGRFSSGYSIVRNDPIDPKYLQRKFAIRGRAQRREQTFEIRDKRLSAEFARVPGVGDRVATVIGPDVVASAPATSDGLAVRPIARTGAADEVDVISSVPGDGVLVPDIIAGDLGIQPGETLRLSTSDSTSHVLVPVKGIYRALSETPLSRYWQSLGNEIQLQLPAGVLPPPFVIASHARATEIIERLTPREAQFRWEFPLESPGGLNLEEAGAISREFERITAEIGRARSRLAKLFYWCPCYINSAPAELRSTLDAAVRAALDRQRGLSAPLGLISNAGALIALTLLGTIAAYAIHRRRTEIVYLLTGGLSPTRVGSRATLEVLLPALAGLALGLAGAHLLIRVVLSGPGPEAVASSDAFRRVALAGLAALVVLGVTSAFAADRRMRSTSGGRRRRFVPLWELPVIALALYGLSSVADRTSLLPSGAASEIDSGVILLFPLALIGGIAGLVARITKRVLRRARRWSERLSDGPHLAVRRLATAPQLALLMFTASALALGTFVYSQTMATTIQRNATTKAYVFVGSDVGVLAGAGAELPASFPFPWTITSQILDKASIDDVGVDVVAVDSSTVARAAYWDDSFSSLPLGELADRLEDDSGEGLSVAVTAPLEDGTRLEIGGVDIPIRVVDHVRAFPGMVAGRTLLVVDSAVLRTRLADAAGLDVISESGTFTQLWIKGEPSAVRRALVAQGYTDNDWIVTTDEILDKPVFVAVRRSFAFLQILGLGSSLIVVLGLLLYLQARQAQRTLSLALAERMGLTRRSHLIALAVELAATLLIALVVGSAVGVGVSSVLFKRLDPLPATAPSPSLYLPVTVGIVLILVLIALTFAGALIADRAARRASVTEVLRYE